MDNETLIRVGFFVGIFGLMAFWEVIASRRELSATKSRRWLNNCDRPLEIPTFEN